MATKAIIVGSSGLIGSKLLDILLQEAFYDEVLIVVRKELPIQHKKLAQLVINFDQLDTYAQQITGHAIFSCLGSTNAKTPDKTVYYKIDHDYPLQLAQLAYKNGVKQFHLVSAVGANAASSMFYVKTKGQTEDDIKKIGFDALHIYRPSMLTGDRKEKRSLEKAITFVFKIIDPLLFGGWKKYRSISDESVARVMYQQSIKNNKGSFIYEFDQIKQLS